MKIGGRRSSRISIRISNLISPPVKTILVTGSAGMLGADLVKALSPHFKVFGLSRHPQASGTGLDIPLNLDLTEKDFLRQKLIEIKPDLVIHTAAFTKVDACEDESMKDKAKKQNTEVAESLIEVCNEIGAFLIFFSTDYVFSGQKKDSYVEDDPIEPINYYGQTKAWAEAAIQEKSKRFIIFRVTWLYGKNGQHFPGAILKQAAQKNELAIVADQWGRPTWTRDIASAISDLLISRQNLLDRYNKQIFHIGNSGQINWSGYARFLLDHCGYSQVQIREISSEELGRAAKRPANSVLNLDKAQSCLGLRLRSWQDALSDFLKEEY